MKRLFYVIFFIFIITPNVFCAWLPGYTNRAKFQTSGAATSNTVADFDVYYNSAPISDNGAFEWHVRPVERYVGTYDKTYVTYYTTDSRVVIREWDNDNKTISDESSLWTSWGNGNDHSCGSVWVIKNGVHAGKILVSVAEHNGRLQTRRSTSAEDISSFDSAVSVEATGASYAVVGEFSDGTLFMTYRGTGTDRHFYYRTSSDSGATWSTSTQLTDFDEFTNTLNTYLHAKVKNDGTGDRIHLMMNIHYGDYRLDIWYAYSDDKGATWKKRDSTAITLPIDQNNADLVYETPATGGQGTITNHDDYTILWDINEDASGNPYLVSLDYVGEGGPTYPITPLPSTVAVRRHNWTGSAWQTETILTNGGLLGTYGYAGGAVLADGDMDKMYICVSDVSSNSQLQVWEKDGTWSKTDDITQSSPGDQFRPASVRNGASPFEVLWGYSESYINYTLGGWESKMMVYPGYNNANRIQLEKNSRTDFGDLRFTASDGSTLIGYNGKGWQSSKVDNWRINVRLKIPSFGDNFCYYGKASDTYPYGSDTLEREAQFDFFDDFEGATIDPSWVNEPGKTTPSVADSEVTIYQDDNYVFSTETVSFGEEVTFRLTNDGGSYLFYLREDGSNRIQIRRVTSTFFSVLSTEDGVDRTTGTFGTPDLTNYNTFTIKLESTSSIRCYVNNEYVGTYSVAHPDGPFNMGLRVYTAGYTNKYDYVFTNPLKPSDYELNVLASEEPVSLTYNINPVTGTWREVGETTWNAHNVAVDVAVGPKNVEFSDVVGRVTPANDVFNISTDETRNIAYPTASKPSLILLFMDD